MYIQLIEAKKHLNLDDFFNEDDEYINSLIDVAEDAISKELGKPLKDCLGKDGGLQPSVKHSILLLIGTYYSQREATTPTKVEKVPYTWDYLNSLNKRYFIS